ncbi:MAG: hypothetical protein RR906_07215 [Acetivibrio sp.]
MRKTKRYLMSALLLVLLTGCTSKEKPNTVPAPDTNTESVEVKEDIMTDFTVLIKNGGTEGELMEYMDKNISKATQDEADQMVLELGKVYKKNLPELEKQFMEANSNPALFDAFELDMKEEYADKISDPELKEFVKTAYKNGYTLLKEEGEVYPVINIAMLDKFTKYTSEPVESLLNLK